MNAHAGAPWPDECRARLPLSLSTDIKIGNGSCS
jgi:hypothetical protein